ncbi:hypothetical protein ALC56_10443, partial [Trachymyrmex septentrionalis]
RKGRRNSLQENHDKSIGGTLLRLPRIERATAIVSAILNSIRFLPARRRRIISLINLDSLYKDVLNERRTVYFGYKSIVHACDASEWVGMHSVCIKRHWPPLATNPFRCSGASTLLYRRTCIVVIAG